MRADFKNNQRGFTLIELLTVIAIIGVLSGISIASFDNYRTKAMYQVVTTSIKNARTALEASLVEPDVTFANVPLYTQNLPGEITDVNAKAVLSTFILARNTKIYFSYDPSCLAGACVSAFIRVRHCSGSEFASFLRQGDGTEILVENISGSGCP
jgi:type IV pilus assembly protein PilA